MPGGSPTPGAPTVNLRGELRIVPFAPALRDHFYRLNEAWLRKYFHVEEIDHRVLSNPEGEVLERGGIAVGSPQRMLRVVVPHPKTDGPWRGRPLEEAQRIRRVHRAALPPKAAP